ncbi:MAG: biosynthetic peptidoglycan transglycosylase [Thermoanaerobaculia bacterium]
MARTRRLALLAVAALLSGAALRGLLALAEAVVEGRVRERLVAGAAERGFALTIDRVRVRFPSRASLLGLSLAGKGVTVRLDRLDARVALLGHGVRDRLRRVELGPLSADLPHGVSLAAAPSSWDVEWSDAALVLAGRGGEGRLVLERPGASSVRIRADRLDLTRLLKLRRDGAWVGDLGVVSALAAVDPAPGGGRSVEASLLARRARLAAPPEDDAPGVAALGGAFDAEGSVTATWNPEARFLEVPCISGTAAGLRGRAHGVLAFAPGDAWFDVGLSVPRLELATLLAASGLGLPSGEDDLGSAALEARVTGRMLDPKSFVVEQKLDFRPPARLPAELEALRGPFRRVMTGRDGRETTVDVDPESPDFVPLDSVPPLFVRALLTSEDAGFWGHPGIDLSEVPVAASINWVRGERARGASTITQQLAKNLFLNRERSYRRKLQEAALALLLEPALGKRRILEIYLNVIEWGPGIHGIGPAARHYFGKSPSELTPRESAFLVALIPGPVKYQTSFADGVLSRGFSRLVNGVLYRLRSVDVLTDDELAAELAAPIRLRWTPPEAAGEEEPGDNGGDAPGEAESLDLGMPTASERSPGPPRDPGVERPTAAPTPQPVATPKATATTSAPTPTPA